MIPNAENARTTAAGGTASSKPWPRSAGVIRKRVHCRMSTLATVKSVTAATRTVVIFSSRRYPPERSSKTAARVVSAAQKCSWCVRRYGFHDAPRKLKASAIGLDAPGKAMWAAWPTAPSIAAIWACVVSIIRSQSQQSQDTPARGPGSESKAASVVLPCVMA